MSKSGEIQSSLKLIYQRSDFESLNHTSSISWTWSAKNQLTLNISKSNHMAFGHHASSLELNPNKTFTPIATVHSCNDLGVHANRSFTLTLNCQSAAEKARAFEDLSKNDYHKLFTYSTSHWFDRT